LEPPRKFEQYKLFKSRALELLKAGKVDTVGLLVAWGWVAVILGVALFLIKFGG